MTTGEEYQWIFVDIDVLVWLELYKINILLQNIWSAAYAT